MLSAFLLKILKMLLIFMKIKITQNPKDVINIHENKNQMTYNL